VRRRAEFQPFSDAARAEPGFSGDVADRVSGGAQSTDLIKDGLPRAAMRLLGKVSMLRDFASATRTALSRCHAKSASGLRLTHFQAAATASRHVVIAAARSTR